MTEFKLDIPEAFVTRTVAALCHAESLTPVNGSNAKLALGKRIRQLVKEQERLEAVAKAESEAPPPVEGIT